MERPFKSFQYIQGRLKDSLFLGVLFTATICATATGTATLILPSLTATVQLFKKT